MAKFIGARSRSKEGPRHVTGRGLFTDDFILPGMLQAMILRSPHAHAKIISVDTVGSAEKSQRHGGDHAGRREAAHETVQAGAIRRRLEAAHR